MKLNKETFDRMISMLESPDTESVILGLSTINECEFKDNIVYTLLLAKEANVKGKDMWRLHADKIYSMYYAMGVDLDKPITFEKILSIAKEYDADINDIQFIMDRYAYLLSAKLNTYLSKPIEKLIIKIKQNHESGRIGNYVKGPDVGGTILRDVSDNAEQEVAE